jgi:3-methyl-2-oxobutanoate hydroxymethyltransferase
MKTIRDFYKMKQAGEKIAMLTCYDYSTAVLAEGAGVDCLLVGDSLAMTMHGFPDTLHATVEMMALHTAAVARGAKSTFIIADMPFLSYRKSIGESVAAAGALMQAGAQAVKLEGAAGNIGLIRHLADSGIPVMGHIGLTPQFVHQIGGYKVQGKTDAEAARLKNEAQQLENAGCFGIVLECVPAPLAAEITKNSGIATIGIGAGRETDGQVLVLQDMLGLNTHHLPRFVKQFLQGADAYKAAFAHYIKDTRSGAFPADEHIY